MQKHFYKRKCLQNILETFVGHKNSRLITIIFKDTNIRHIYVNWNQLQLPLTYT